MAKTKALISFAVTAKLVCVFVFAEAEIRFSHDMALMDILPLLIIQEHLSVNGERLCNKKW